MHDFSQLLPHVAPLLADGPSSGSIKVALITAISVVLAAGLSALAVMRSKDQPINPDVLSATEQIWTAFNAELSRRAVTAEGRCAVQEIEISRLRDLCWALGHDPDNDLPQGAKP